MTESVDFVDRVFDTTSQCGRKVKQESWRQIANLLGHWVPSYIECPDPRAGRHHIDECGRCSCDVKGSPWD